MFEGLLQPTHLAIILVIALIVLGPGKLGEVGGQLGRGVREFRTAMDDPAADRPALTRGGATSCRACGAPLAADARFCPSCGARRTAPAG